jgi:hypothetical protein
VTLALPDSGGRRLTLEYAELDGAARALGLVVPAGNSLSGQVLVCGEPITVENFAADPRTADVTRVAMGHIGPAALFPLGAPGNVRGVLTVGRRQGKPPLQHSAVGAVAAQAATAANGNPGRATALGGELRLSPVESGGTELEWKVPVPPDPVGEGDNARPSSPGKYPIR